MKDQTPQEETLVYFISACLVIYEVDGNPKQRTLNVLLEAPSPQLTKASLAQVQRSAIARVHAENNIEISSIRDVVIMSISPMGMMPPSIFNDGEVPEEASEG